MCKKRNWEKNTYCTEFKDYINKKLEHKSICKRHGNEIFYEKFYWRTKITVQKTKLKINSL